jgi:hypothetical protein
MMMVMVLVAMLMMIVAATTGILVGAMGHRSLGSLRL